MAVKMSGLSTHDSATLSSSWGKTDSSREALTILFFHLFLCTIIPHFKAVSLELSTFLPY